MLRSQDLFVRCMLRREGSVWVALCIDYTLAAQGSTIEQAREKLHAQIFDYVQEALTVDAEHAEELLTRRAPLRHRLLYWLAGFARAHPARLQPPGRALAYSEPLPMTLAAA